MTSCLLCAANNMERGSWIQVFYNSARSNDEQSARGRVNAIKTNYAGQLEVTFQRKDGQEMTVDETDKLVSHGSHYPVTGYAYRYEVKTPQKQTA